ncbi:ECF transporter S component [Clostridium aciditolerans]|uniref:Riboflavin transporter n=1 Tax=Clostridium aciditolerans TaxID=339861 RepID=A0A934I0X3_9CLOT|nr:ECF transporter S component [Clostridium aciditolerans]MBI6874000.1 ECF transporter S component [Clostridium aciditolerans]
MKDQKLNRLVKISMLSVIAFILMFIEVATPFFPPFLKFDISDLPALIGAFALGPVAGVGIELLKNILHGIFVGGSAFVGELANFLVGAVMVYVSGYIYNKRKSRGSAVTSLIAGTLIMTVVASVLNYFVFLPLYEAVLHFPINAIVEMGNKINSSITDLNSFVVWAIAPFNLIKGILVSVLTMLVYKSVSPILHKEGEKESNLVKNN